jgi:hypothetical protein
MLADLPQFLNWTSFMRNYNYSWFEKKFHFANRVQTNESKAVSLNTVIGWKRARRNGLFAMS